MATRSISYDRRGSMTRQELEAWLDAIRGWDPDRVPAWIESGKEFGPGLLEQIGSLWNEPILAHRRRSVRVALINYLDLEDAAHFPYYWKPHERAQSPSQLAALPPNTTAVELMPSKTTTDFSGFAAHLASLKRLESIRVSRGQSADLEFVRDCGTLTNLELPSVRVTVDIGAIAALSGLEYLRIGHGEYRNVGGIASLKKLTSLAFSDVPTGFEYLDGLKKLVFLRLEGFSDVQAGEALSLPQLKALRLFYGSKIVRLGKITGAAASLREVTIAFCPKLTDCSDLREAAHLTHLTLRNLPQLQDLSWLPALKHLNSLRIEKCARLNGTIVIEKLPQLQELTYADMGTVPSLGFLANLRNLRHLNLAGTRIGDRNYEPLFGLGNLLTAEAWNLKPQQILELRRKLPDLVFGGRESFRQESSSSKT
jgi:hypothetical protein